MILRRAAGRVKRVLAPSPTQRAYRRLLKRAKQAPRRQRGTIQLLGKQVAYADALTTCPQWLDIMVRETMACSMGEPRPRILDCGANIGLASWFFSRRWPSARVTAFEADRHIFQILKKNLSTWGLEHVEPVEAAVWNREGHVTFYSEGADAGSVLAEHVPHGPEVRVKSIRLRDWLTEPVDLLKMDIEGAEFDVLEDCEDALGQVRAMYIEVHEFDSSLRRAPRLLDLVRDAGFSYTVSELVAMPWRETVAEPSTFAGASAQWAFVVRAWRTRSS